MYACVNECMRVRMCVCACMCAHSIVKLVILSNIVSGNAVYGMALSSGLQIARFQIVLRGSFVSELCSVCCSLARHMMRTAKAMIRGEGNRAVSLLFRSLHSFRLCNSYPYLIFLFGGRAIIYNDWREVTLNGVFPQLRKPSVSCVTLISLKRKQFTMRAFGQIKRHCSNQHTRNTNATTSWTLQFG